MPLPTSLHVDTFLTNAAAGYKNDSYIAATLLPIIPIVKETGSVAAYGMDHYRIDPIVPRSYGGRAARVDWSTGTPVTFSAKEWTIEHAVDDRLIDYADDPFQPLVDGAFVVQEKLSLKLEDLVGTLMTTTGNFGGNTDGTDWTTVGTGTPIKDIRAAMASIITKSGVSPSSLYGAMSWTTFNNAIQCTEVKNVLINTNPGAAAAGNITPAMLASLIGLAGIYVAPAVKVTSLEGQATLTYASCFPDHYCAVYMKAGRPSLQTPSFAAILAVNKFGGATVAFDRYREEATKSTIIRGTTMYDQIAVNKNMGWLLTGLNA